MRGIAEPFQVSRIFELDDDLGCDAQSSLGPRITCGDHVARP